MSTRGYRIERRFLTPQIEVYFILFIFLHQSEVSFLQVQKSAIAYCIFTIDSPVL